MKKYDWGPTYTLYTEEGIEFIQREGDLFFELTLLNYWTGKRHRNGNPKYT